MSYYFRSSDRWFSDPLCCRYLVVRFSKLRVPMKHGRLITMADWHWALGLFIDGGFEVLGAWRDEGVARPDQIAANLHERGLERIKALGGDEGVVAAMGRFRPTASRQTMVELAESGAFGLRMRQAIRWTDTASRQLHTRMQRVAGGQQTLPDDAAAADFIAQAFQRADRDLLNDRWRRVRPAPYGASASATALTAMP